MSFSDAAENAILALIFNGTTWTGIAQNTTTSPLTSLYLSLHITDISTDDTATQTTGEATYTGYARAAVARSTAGFTTPSGGATNLTANVDFPVGTGGSGTVTSFAVGHAASGAGNIIMKGAITPTIATGNGVQPRLTTATTFSLN